MSHSNNNEDNRLEKIYGNTPGNEIPWNRDQVAKELVDLIEERTIQPCRVLEIGCGVGTDALYLADQGFIVTGIDLSLSAISKAKNMAKERKLECNFRVADFLNMSIANQEYYDFIFDWWVFHHILPEQRKVYVSKVHELLKPEGKYLSVCFAESDPAFGGKSKVRVTPLHTTLYFSTGDEIVELHHPDLRPIQIKKIVHQQTKELHHSIYALFKKEAIE